MLLALYPWIKVLHILAVIALYAGVMYLPRLFIYHHQATPGGEAEGLFQAMERRLYKGIMNPSLVAVWVFGLLMIAAVPSYATSVWFLIKFALVIALTGIHGFYGGAVKKFAAGERPKDQKFWRMMNEVPFVFLIIIVIMVIVKPFSG